MQRLLGGVFCAVALLAGGAQAQLSDYFTEADAKWASDHAPGRMSKALAGGDVAGAAFDAQALAALGQAPKSACSGFANAVRSAKDVRTLAAAGEAAAALGCAVEAPKGAAALVDAAVGGDASLADVAAAVSAIEALGLGRSRAGKVEAAVEALAALLEDDGTTRTSAAADAPASVENTGVALRALAAAVRVLGSADKAADAVQAFADAAVAAAADAEAVGSRLEFDGSSRLSATALFLAGAADLATAAGKGVEIDLGTDTVAGLAAGVLARKGYARRSGEGLFLVVAGLRAATSLPGAPVAVTLDPAHIPASASAADGRLRVRVTDALGRPVKGAKATAVSVAQSGGEEPVVADTKLSGTGGVLETEFVGSGAKPSPGAYAVTLSVTPKGGAAFKVARALKVVTEAVVADAKVTVQHGDGESSEHEAAFPQPVAAPVQAGAQDTVDVAFAVRASSDGAALRPHQVFVRLTHATGAQTHFVARRRSSRGHYTASLDLSGQARTLLDHCSGRYAVHVVVGDVSMRRALVYHLADADLDLPAKPEAKESPLYYKPLLDDSDRATAPLPEIHHQFKEPERRPPGVISLTFTALTLVRARRHPGRSSLPHPSRPGTHRPLHPCPARRRLQPAPLPHRPRLPVERGLPSPARRRALPLHRLLVRPGHDADADPPRAPRHRRRPRGEPRPPRRRRPVGRREQAGPGRVGVRHRNVPSRARWAQN